MAEHNLLDSLDTKYGLPVMIISIPCTEAIDKIIDLYVP